MKKDINSIKNNKGMEELIKSFGPSLIKEKLNQSIIDDEIDSIFKLNACYNNEGDLIKNRLEEIINDWGEIVYQEDRINLIRSIKIENKSIEKIPINLKYFLNLEVLDLKKNKISKIEGLEDCINLKTLNLENNQIIENINNLNIKLLSIMNSKIKYSKYENFKNIEIFLETHENILNSLEDVEIHKENQKIKLKIFLMIIKYIEKKEYIINDIEIRI